MVASNLHIQCFVSSNGLFPPIPKASKETPRDSNGDPANDYHCNNQSGFAGNINNRRGNAQRVDVVERARVSHCELLHTSQPTVGAAARARLKQAGVVGARRLAPAGFTSARDQPRRSAACTHHRPTSLPRPYRGVCHRHPPTPPLAEHPESFEQEQSRWATRDRCGRTCRGPCRGRSSRARGTQEANGRSLMELDIDGLSQIWRRRWRTWRQPESRSRWFRSHICWCRCGLAVQQRPVQR